MKLRECDKCSNKVCIKRQLGISVDCSEFTPFFMSNAEQRRWEAQTKVKEAKNE